MRWGERRSAVDEREEVLSHIRIEADRLVSEGVAPGEAMERARERFGHHATLEPTHVGRARFAEVVARDARHAVRRLLAAPLSTATILLSLIVGIGVNTAIFSLADQALLRPLPVPDPGTLVQLEWDGQWVGEGRGWGSLLPHPLFRALGDEQQVFSSMAARSPGEVTVMPPTGAERAQISLVTGEYFDVMGVRPHLGRVLGSEDDRILDGHPVVVLSHAYWQSRYGADPGVLGRQITMNGRPMTIVGVAPEGFHGTDWSQVPAMWTSMMMNGLVHRWGGLDEPRIRFQHVYARLRSGVSRLEAETAIQPWFQRYLRVDMERPSWPGDREPSEISAYLSSRLAVSPGGQGQAARAEELKEPVLILSAATALLLLLACLNVANLSVARAVARYRDTAVRAALGASRTKIMGERFVEAALLAAVGGALGVALAPAVSSWILQYLGSGGPEMSLSAELDGRTLWTAFFIATVATILSAVGPAWYASTTRPMAVLRSSNSASGVRLRKVLVVGQVALALVLLMGAGLFGSTLHQLRSLGPGFPTDQLVSFSVNPVNDGYQPLQGKLVLQEILESAQTLPGVEDAGLAAWALLEGAGWGNSMVVEGNPPKETPEYLPMNAVTPGFFDVLGRSIVRGRDFDAADHSTGEEWRWDHVIVSQSFVDRYLDGREPIGLRIDIARDLSEMPQLEIVGVVEDFAEHRLRDPLPQVYFPMMAQLRRGGTFYVRTDAPLGVIAPQIRQAVEDIDPALSIADVRTVDEQIDRLLVFERMLSALGTAFAVFGVFLAMIGVYGVLSFMVQSRTKEMGIRMALGAPVAVAARVVFADALRLSLFGVAVALPAIWILGRLVQSWLFGVDAMSVAGLSAATSVVVGLCVFASAGPARRLARTDPLEALRVE